MGLPLAAGGEVGEDTIAVEVAVVGTVCAEGLRASATAGLAAADGVVLVLVGVVPVPPGPPAPEGDAELALALFPPPLPSPLAPALPLPPPPLADDVSDVALFVVVVVGITVRDLGLRQACRPKGIVFKKYQRIRGPFTHTHVQSGSKC